jgi:HEAT repeat protein
MSPRRPPDPRTAAELVAALAGGHFNERALALAELVARGRESTAALLSAFPTAEPEVRARIAQGLAEIADPASADTLAAMLDDSDERVRARGAQGLARMHDPRAVDALLRTIDDYPDVLREPDTLATDGLVDLGPQVLPRVAPLLKAPDRMTRSRAFLVIRRLVPRLPGGDDWKPLWESLGRYDPGAPQPDRDAAADRWREWIANPGAR